MAANWSWLLCDPAGLPLAELTTATARSIAYARNTYAEATFTISHDDDAASLMLGALTNGIPTLRCYRRAAGATAGVLRFNGYLAAVSESAEEDASSVQAVFRGPFAKLTGDGADRGRFTAAAVTFAATDAGQIAKSLIDTTNTDSFTGLATTGTITPTKLRDRTYVYANVGEAVVNLSKVLQGFDFEEAYVEGGTTLAQLNIYASQGQDRPLARFEYGPQTLANVRSLSRAIQPPANVARMLGGNGLSSTATDAASIAKYGKWWIQQSATDVIEQVTLDDKASSLLRPNPVKTIQFVPDLDLSPVPFDDFWLGDTIRLYARRGALSENVTVRVNAVTIAIDDNGDEATEIDQSELERLDVDPAGQAFDDAVRAQQQAANDAAATTIDIEIVS